MLIGLPILMPAYFRYGLTSCSVSGARMTNTSMITFLVAIVAVLESTQLYGAKSILKLMKLICQYICHWSVK